MPGREVVVVPAPGSGPGNWAGAPSAARDGIEATDDAMLVERIGQPVFLLEGERTNIKITVPEDVLLAEALLRDGRAC